jgi:hypothetical protein
MKFSLKDILFWIFLIISIILIIWNVFGNSPTEFIALTALIVTVLLQLWRVSDRTLKLEMKFSLLAKDFKEHVRKK